MHPELSLPVVWTEDGGAARPGCLELDRNVLRLVGGSRDAEQSRELALDQIASTHVGRTAADRIGGRPTLVLELHDAGPIRIAGFARIGALSELAERLLAGNA
jgi:hypothetical protein